MRQGGVIDNEKAIAEGLRLVEEAEGQGIHMRLLGAVAIRVHCPRFGHLYENIDRPITDLDVIALGRHNVTIQDFMAERGYEPDPVVMRYYGSSRHIYQRPGDPLKIDVFFDALRFCHVVDFRQRIALDFPTITITDILLEKMQIVEINPKDLKDTVILLREHGLAPEERKECVNTRYLGELLGSDWGYWYTVTQNLGKVREYAVEGGAFSPEDVQVVTDRIDELRRILEECPKSMKWKLRSRLGTRVKWYTEVEEVHRDQ